MNRTILIGRLTGEPEIRNTTDGTCIARFRLAVDRRSKRDGEQTADFIGCVSFGKTAEFIEKYVKKGTKIATVGRIQTGSYTNRDGQKVYTTDIVVEECEFCESKKSQDEPEHSEQRPVKDDNPTGGFNYLPDEELDLPFK